MDFRRSIDTWVLICVVAGEEGPTTAVGIQSQRRAE
jgi:hypothetical protein